MEEKKIHFVSWKKHKVDQALTQVDNVYQGFIDELIFETVLDCCREKAYPRALPVREIIQCEPVLPSSPFQFQFEPREMQRLQVCPICKERVSASYTSHLHEKCFARQKKLEACIRYFEEANAPHP